MRWGWTHRIGTANDSAPTAEAGPTAPMGTPLRRRAALTVTNQSMGFTTMTARCASVTASATTANGVGVGPAPTKPVAGCQAQTGSLTSWTNCLLHRAKDHDYSPYEYLGNYRAAIEFGVAASLGAMLRVSDKIERMKHVLRRG